MLALGPALIAGAVGYAGARLQFHTAIQQIEADTARLRAQYSEDERKHRRRSYHDFLTLMYRLDAMMAGFAELSKETFDRWLDDYRNLHAGIELYGSASVRERLQGVSRAVDRVGLQARQARPHGAFERQFADAYRRHRVELIATVERAIEEMRSDVA
jgi:hypothetical protein